MRKRPLGKDGPAIPVLGLGCMGMSDFYGEADQQESVATLHRALDLGCTFLDTSDIYGPHTNEVLVGQAILDRRDQVTLATKFGILRDDAGAFLGVDSSPAYVSKACDASLRRLGVDVIDLYYQHRVDPKTPIEDTVGAMAELVEAGKVRFLGLCPRPPPPRSVARAPCTPSRRSRRSTPSSAATPRLELLDTCAELGVTFVAYSPLGRGFLSGAIRKAADLQESDWRHGLPRFQGESLESNLRLVDRITAIARREGHHAGPAGPGLGPRPGRPRRGDPRHDQAPAAGGEHPGRRHRPHRRRPAASRRGGPRRRGGGHALSRGRDEGRGSLKPGGRHRTRITRRSTS